MNYYVGPLPKDMAEIIASHFLNTTVDDDYHAISDDDCNETFDDIPW